MKTNQEIFDEVAVGLLTQNEKSIAFDGMCLYRLVMSDRTLKCGAGMLIPDEAYREEFESQVFVRLMDRYPELLDAMQVGVEQVELISALQVVHDSCGEVKWKAKLADVAQTFELSTEVLDRF